MADHQACRCPFGAHLAFAAQALGLGQGGLDVGHADVEDYVGLVAGAAADEFPALVRSSQRTMASNARLRKGILVAHPVVHFEIIGKNPDKLRNYFGELFGWQFDTSSPVAEAVSEPTNYGFVDRITTPDGTGIPGGIGGGARYPGHVIFYVGVPNVEAALAEAERLGGKRQMGTDRNPDLPRTAGGKKHGAGEPGWLTSDRVRA